MSGGPARWLHGGVATHAPSAALPADRRGVPPRLRTGSDRRRPPLQPTGSLGPGASDFATLGVTNKPAVSKMYGSPAVAAGLRFPCNSAFTPSAHVPRPPSAPDAPICRSGSLGSPAAIPRFPDRSPGFPRAGVPGNQADQRRRGNQRVDLRALEADLLGRGHGKSLL